MRRACPAWRRGVGAARISRATRRRGTEGGRGISADGVEYHPRLQDLPAHDRPRERLYYQGPAALKEEELVAIILRTGTRDVPVLDLARKLLARYAGLGGVGRGGGPGLLGLNGLGLA